MSGLDEFLWPGGISERWVEEEGADAWIHQWLDGDEIVSQEYSQTCPCGRPLMAPPLSLEGER